MGRRQGWNGTNSIREKSYTCGFCHKLVGSDVGFFMNDQVAIYICPFCAEPTYFGPTGSQTPGVAFGSLVEHLPKDVASLYDEARRCMSVSAYTSAVLACRKLLMNTAVAQGAEAGKRFIEYVEYLNEKGYVPPNGRGWVDHIRRKGNEATHEIQMMSKQDGEELISFTEMLLKFIFEFPARVPNSSSENPAN